MKRTHRRAAICLWILSGVAALTAVKAEVKLEAEQRENLGIESSVTALTQVAQSYAATAQVLDAAPLIALLRDLRTAQSAANASKSEFERATQLHAADGNVSSKTLDAARVQALTDSGHADTLQAQIVTAWGPAIAAMQESTREKLIGDLLAGRAVLLRAETRTAGQAAIRTGKLRLVASGENYSAEVLGVAANGAQSIGQSYLLKAVATSLQVGQVLEAELEDPRQMVSGTLVPRAAIVRWQGGDWIYLETETNHFERKAIHPVLWTDDGCLVQKEIAAGQRIVTAGAGLLLGAENAPPAKEE